MGAVDARDCPAEGQPIHVRKLRPDGTEVFAWDGTVVRCDAEGIVLRAEFNVAQVDLGFTTFRRGDAFLEHYYWDRWYNVFRISEPDGTLRGWYCNVGAPAEVEDRGAGLCYVDLALDVWVQPDGRSYQVLDEDELEAEVTGGEHGFTSPLADSARKGLDALLDLVRSGGLP